MRTKSIMGGELTTQHRLVAGNFDYAVVSVVPDEYNPDLLWVTVHTGYTTNTDYIRRDFPIVVLDPEPRTYHIRVNFSIDSYTQNTVTTDDIEDTVRQVEESLRLVKIPFLDIDYWAA
ncbi:MAG TPA: hypothetical protein VIY48_14255 [Candidatus Paceibacterota bacterium]